MERLETLLIRIEKILQNLERAPRMWGGDDAQEALVFALVGLRQVIFGYPEFDTLTALIHFTRAVNGQSDNRPLSYILREEGMSDQLPRLLGDFARCVARDFPPLTPDVVDWQNQQMVREVMES